MGSSCVKNNNATYFNNVGAEQILKEIKKVIGDKHINI